MSYFVTPSACEFDFIKEKVSKHLTDGGSESRIPQAIARAIGTGQIHKSQLGAVDAQLTASAKFTGWLGCECHS
jgi:hypothetical protein